MTRGADDPWRVIDTGLRSAAENIALNRALLEAHQAGEAPHTLRFLRFQPAALLGFHQHVKQELRLDYCRQHDISIQRRITGGGAIFFDPAQLGWELYLHKNVFKTSDLSVIAARVCNAAAIALQRLGIDAQFRPRNDIEVDGRKISGTGGAFDGDSILYQGTLLLNFDVERMLRVLRIPMEKLTDKAIDSARDRVVNLSELLGMIPDLEEIKQNFVEVFASEFGVGFKPDNELTETEHSRYQHALAEIDTEEWVFQHDRALTESPTLEAVYRSKGGILRVNLKLDLRRQRIAQVWFHGDFFVHPRRTIPDLEAALKDIPVKEVESCISDFFRQRQVDMLLLRAADFTAAVREALRSCDTELTSV